MKSHLEIVRLEPHTDEWYEFRLNGIGGSEIGTVLNINKYDTAIRLFHEKLGTVPQRKEDNERMFWGRQMEEHIAKMWRYYDGTRDGYVENYKNDRIIRECRSLNGYVVNPKYPWLFASVDRLINIKGGFNLITGEPLTEEAILECKNMGYWMSQIWEDGIPIYHLAQIHVYMAILETDYAEIAMLVDGANLVVEKVQRDDILIEKILKFSKDWWYERVVPAKEAARKRDLEDINGNVAEAERHEATIQRLEPEPDESEAYKEFMEERFLQVRETIEGTMQLYAVAKRDKFLQRVKSKIDDERTRLKNIFVQFLVNNNAEVIDFGRLGTINWTKRKGAQSRTMTNKIKEKPDDDLIENQVRGLDHNIF